MIRITIDGDRRNYTVPRALLAVAHELFPSADDDEGAIFHLFRSLVSDDLATVSSVAAVRGHAAAVALARERLVRRRT